MGNGDGGNGEGRNAQVGVGGQLPEGWKEFWSRSRTAHYYRNMSTGQVLSPYLDAPPLSLPPSRSLSSPPVLSRSALLPFSYSPGPGRVCLCVCARVLVCGCVRLRVCSCVFARVCE